MQDARTMPESGIRNPRNPLIIEALDILRKNYATEISLSSLADELHVNHSYLSRLFAKETGRTFLHWLNSIRVEEAKKLLDARGKIYLVAEQVGFSGPKYFSQVFRRFTGFTPQEYRSGSGGANK
jgi:two-component system response regulator YesN